MRIILRSRDRRGSIGLRLLFIIRCHISLNLAKNGKNKSDLAVPGCLEKIVYDNN